MIAAKLKSWPHEGKIGIKESNPLNGITQVHIFDRWCYLGVAEDDVQLDVTNRRITSDIRNYRYVGNDG